MKLFNRTVLVAAALPAAQARAVVTLLCASAKQHPLEQKRNKLQANFHKSLVKVLDFAKHETLRKAHRHLYSHRPLMGQNEGDQTPDHPDASKINFNPDEVDQDLNSTLRTNIPPILAAGAQDVLASIGYDAPYQLPAQDVLNFIAKRQNLLSNVPDEIYQQVQKEISEGLNAGESLGQISDRITKVFDEIAQGRADVIAATETAAAYGYAGYRASVAAGVGYKKWLHSVIPKEPRPDHVAIDGLIVPIDQPYPVGDPQLMYPHAPDGSPEDVINCRCLSIPVTEEDYLAQQK